jgi:hypothetical protein
MDAFLAFEEMEQRAFLDLDEYEDIPRPRSQVDEQYKREYYEWVDAMEEDFEREWDDDPRVAEEAEADSLLREADELIASTDRLLAELDEEGRHS